MNSEELESLLRDADASAGELIEPSANLADRVRSVHAHRRRRDARAKFAVALACCYGAGLATAWILFALATEGDGDIAQRGSPLSPPPGSSVNGPSHPSDKQELAIRKTRPYAPVQPSDVAERSRYELFRQLGDESHERGDIQTAVSYYGEALDAATDVERMISYQQDSWLLITLKKDRLALLISPSQGDSI